MGLDPTLGWRKGHGVKAQRQLRESVSTSMCVCLCAQTCPLLCDPMDCSPPGSPVHGISQARILELVAISFSRGSSQGLNLHLMSPALAGRSFTTQIINFLSTSLCATSSSFPETEVRAHPEHQQSVQTNQESASSRENRLPIANL